MLGLFDSNEVLSGDAGRPRKRGTRQLPDPTTKLTKSGSPRWDRPLSPPGICRRENRPQHAFKPAVANHGPRSLRDGINDGRGRVKKKPQGSTHGTGARAPLQACFPTFRTFAIQAPRALRAGERLLKVRRDHGIRPTVKRQRAILVRQAGSLLENLGCTQ